MSDDVEEVPLIFNGTDLGAELSVRGSRLVIEFKLLDNAAAHAMAARLLAAHAAGNPVIITLSNPLIDATLQ